MIGAAKKRWSERKRKKRVAALGELELPSFSQPVMLALAKLRDEKTTLRDIGAILAEDPCSSLRILRTVGSAACGLSRRIDNVPHAVALLGRGQTESILLAVAVASTVPRPRTTHFDPSRFWLASARRALLARAFAERIDPRNAWTSYTAALLQDVALPLLVTAHGEAYDQVLAEWRASDQHLTAIERSAFSWDHAEVGGQLAEAWKLPESLRAGISGHHGALDGSHPAVTLVSHLHEEEDEPSNAERIISLAEETFELPPDETVAMVASAFDRAGELARGLM